ncbi:hypothetical protein JTB14_023619 [Gonioctena quinquepunctata]|nr:hypothetical protein JTB14_023619 [Gonioctena quinquepunctata]
MPVGVFTVATLFTESRPECRVMIPASVHLQGGKFSSLMRTSDPIVGEGPLGFNHSLLCYRDWEYHPIQSQKSTSIESDTLPKRIPLHSKDLSEELESESKESGFVLRCDGGRSLMRVESLLDHLRNSKPPFFSREINSVRRLRVFSKVEEPQTKSSISEAERITSAARGTNKREQGTARGINRKQQY